MCETFLFESRQKNTENVVVWSIVNRETRQNKEAVLVHDQDDPVAYSGIFCSDSEYGFLLLKHILDSYQLNLVSEETSLIQQCLYENLGVQVGI